MGSHILLNALILLMFLSFVFGAHDHNHGHNHHHNHNHNHDDHSHDHSHHHDDSKKKSTTTKTASPHSSSSNELRSGSQVWLYAVGSTVGVGLAPIVILFFVPITGRQHDANLLRTLLGFAVGGLLGDVFLHLIPHSIDPHDHSGGDHHHHHQEHDHSRGIIVGLWVLAGIIVFFAIEKWVRSKAGGGGAHSHSHSHDHKKNDDAPQKQRPLLAGVEVSGWLNLVADFSHNVTDGLAIGASFLASNRLGIITTVAVIIHEIPHEIGDFAILIRSGMSRRGAILAQVLTALGCVGGTIIGLVAHQLSETSAWILPFTSGGFIYIACTSVLPDLLEDCSFKQSCTEIIALLLGVAMMLGICLIE